MRSLGAQGNGTVYYTASKDAAQATVFATLLKAAYPFAGGGVLLDIPAATARTSVRLAQPRCVGASVCGEHVCGI